MKIHSYIFILLIGLYFSYTLAQTNNTERIISFHSEITINEDASMDVIEKIHVYASGNKIKRGIFRDFPTDYKDDYGNKIRIKFDVIEVLRDGNRESYHTERLSNGIRVYVGRSDYFLPPGEYTYSIKYRTNRQIGYFDKFDELYWNVTGNGWDFIIEKASTLVKLPSRVSGDDIKLFGYTGYSGSKETNYNARVLNSQTIEFQSNSVLNPREGLTIVVQFPKGTVYEPSQSDKVNYFIEDNRQSFIGMIGILMLILFYSIIWWRVGKDPSKGLIIPLYEPPDNMSPAAVRFILEMGYDNKTFTSIIVSLAVKGYLKIEEDDKDYLLKNSSSKQQLTPDEQIVYDKLGFVNNGRTTLKLEQKNHAILQRAIKGLKKSLKNSYEKRYFLTNRKYFIIGLAISVLVLLVSNIGGSEEQIFSLVWISFWSIGVAVLLFSVFRAWKGALNKGRGKVTALGGAIFITLFAIPFVIGEIVGLYFLSEAGSPLMIVIVGLVAVINLIFYHLLKAPTLLGRKLMDKIEGFKMYLGVAEKDDLYSFSMQEPEKTPALFEQFLPFALALDVENKWTEKFSDTLSSIKGDSDSYRPIWYSGTNWSTLGASGFASSLAGGLNSTISSSSTAPGSSSGGSGGSSGGGGGGGGGGGW